ncbi:MAG TPA: hypothetical protein VEM35_07780, partial [Rhizomicrobium sp.]|nr:hypothetical protein [Rhizomicrobium sp.]
MMVGMLVAGIGLVLAGLLAVGYGISVKEFSVGNTLILSGVIGVCTGALMFGFWMAVRELKRITLRLGAGVPLPRGEVAVRPVLAPGLQAMESAAGNEPTTAPAPSSPSSPPPWQDEAASRGSLRGDASAEAAPAEA